MNVHSFLIKKGGRSTGQQAGYKQQSLRIICPEPDCLAYYYPETFQENYLDEVT
jgi:hypothetical protein